MAKKDSKELDLIEEIINRGRINEKLYTWQNMDDYNILLEEVKRLRKLQ